MVDFQPLHASWEKALASGLSTHFAQLMGVNVLLWVFSLFLGKTWVSRNRGGGVNVAHSFGVLDVDIESCSPAL